MRGEGLSVGNVRLAAASTRRVDTMYMRYLLVSPSSPVKKSDLGVWVAQLACAAVFYPGFTPITAGPTPSCPRF